MRIRLLAFATAREALGHDELAFEVPDGSTVGDLGDHLRRDYPDLATIWTRLAIAVDGDLAHSDDAIPDGAEVALLPPVSGGSPETRTRLVEEPIDIEAVRTSASHTSCGAVLLFVGTVRDHHDSRSVTGITYNAYRPMAVRRLEAIATELEEGAADLRVRVVHRLGPIVVGEASVVIAVSSPHRDEAYRASRQALERLKQEVPIWKQEHYADGLARWREEESLV